MQIRQGNVRDWPFVFALAKEAIPASISHWRRQPLEETMKYRLKILKGFWTWIQQTDSKVFLIEDVNDGKTESIGYLVLYPGSKEELTGLPQAWIMDFAVVPEWRGRGVGKALLQAAEDYCGANGISYLGLAVTSTNNNALKLYEKFGFAEERKLMVKVLDK